MSEINSLDTLKPREIEILCLMAEDLTNREIAEQLYIGVETVRWYAKKIYSKLDVSGREEAASKAQALGLLDKDEPYDLLPPVTRPKHNLPTQLTSFIGREKQIEEVIQFISNTRLLTLTGPGGTGKTRLSLKVAEHIIDDFVDGIRFIDLAPVAESSGVTSAIASALHIFEGGDQPILETIKRAIAQRKLLLLIDNYEHVIVAAPLVVDLLSASPNLTIIVTSREPLRVSGEQVYSVPPLSLFDEHQEAVSLFVQRSQAVKRRFELDAHNVETVQQICRRLDGMPLAIELAAAQSRFLTPDAILERIGKRFQSLKGGSRDAPMRQQTLRNVIDWSYDLLNADEKILFARLSVFRGGRSLDAIEAVCSDNLTIDGFDGLAALVDKNMIYQIEDFKGDPRFIMLETIQEYGLERLEQSDEGEILRANHAKYFVDLTEQAEPQLELEHQQEWFQILEIEHDNIRSALRWALSGTAPEQGCRLINSLWAFWLYQGYHAEKQRWITHAMEYAADVSPQTRGRLFYSFAISMYLSRWETSHQGLSLTTDAMDIFRELGDDHSMALAQLIWAVAQTRQSHDYKSVIDTANSAIDILRLSNNQFGFVRSLNARGVIHEMNDNFEMAGADYEECLALCRELGNRRRESIILSNLGRIAIHKGQYTEAEKLLKSSIKLMVELNFNYMFTIHLVQHATLGLGLGRPDWAAQLLGASVGLQDSMGVLLQAPGKREFEHTESEVREQLDDATFQSAWHVGKNMTYDEVVAFVLRV